MKWSAELSSISKPSKGPISDIQPQKVYVLEYSGGHHSAEWHSDTFVII